MNCHVVLEQFQAYLPLQKEHPARLVQHEVVFLVVHVPTELDEVLRVSPGRRGIFGWRIGRRKFGIIDIPWLAFLDHLGYLVMILFS